MAEILEIENIEIDLSDNPISLNKQAYRVADWSQNTLTFSDRVTLPDSGKLREIFKRPDNPEIRANKFGQYYKFKYKDFNTILFAGNSILLQANDDIQIQLIDEAKEFFDNLNESIKKLDFESDDFVFSVAEYDLKKIANSSVWIWPAVCMHTNRNVNNTILAGGVATAKLKFSRPMFDIFTIRQKIFEKHGWTATTCAGLSIVETVAISSNAKTFYVTSYQKTLAGILSGALTGLTTNDFNYGITVNLSSLDIGNITTIFRLRGYITASVDSTFTISGISSPSGTDTQIQNLLIKEGTFYYDFSSNQFKTIENSNIITFSITTTGIVDFDNTLLYTIIEEQELGALSGNNLLNYLVKVYDNLPDFTQKELLLNCFSMFGMFFNVKTFKKELDIYSYNIINKLNALDWSDKYLEDTADFEGKIGNYGRTNYFSYDNDDTIVESVGRGEFLVNNDTLVDIKTVYKNLFGASNDVVIDSLEMADFNIYNDTERINEINDRILFYKLDSGRGITHATFAELSGDVLLNDYHHNIVDSVFDTLVVEAEFALNRNDFFSFDFKQPIYLRQFRSYFLVLNIESFVNGQTTKIKLLKFK